jgi:hypothetical protein
VFRDPHTALEVRLVPVNHLSHPFLEIPYLLVVLLHLEVRKVPDLPVNRVVPFVREYQEVHLYPETRVNRLYPAIPVLLLNLSVPLSLVVLDPEVLCLPYILCLLSPRESRCFRGNRQALCHPWAQEIHRCRETRLFRDLLSLLEIHPGQDYPIFLEGHQDQVIPVTLSLLWIPGIPEIQTILVIHLILVIPVIQRARKAQENL